MALRRKVLLTVTGCLVTASMMPRSAAAQHVTVDGRLSPAQTLLGPNYSIAANLGKQVGGSLFHSFGQFGLSTGESAAFSGPATVNNVIGRVTGGRTRPSTSRAAFMPRPQTTSRCQTARNFRRLIPTPAH